MTRTDERWTAGAVHWRYNLQHAFLIHDMNGLPHASATTKLAAIRRAKILAQETGLDMQIAYRRFRQPHILWVRTQKQKRYLNLNGTWSDAR